MFYDKAPDHSVLSKTQSRKYQNSELETEVFEVIVKKCIEEGLVDGNILLIDSTHVDAYADNNKVYTKKVIKEEREFHNEVKNEVIKDIKNKGKTKHIDLPEREKQNITVSVTDTSCGMYNRPGKKKGLHHLNHQVSDSQCGIVVGIERTAGNYNDFEVVDDIINDVISRFSITPEILVGDTGYDVTEAHKKMKDKNIKLVVARKTIGNKNKKRYDRYDFIFDSQKDEYICKEGNRLGFSYPKFDKRTNYYTKVYSSSRHDCRVCKRKDECISLKSGRKRIQIPYFDEIRSMNYDYIDNNSDFYKELMKLRKIYAEGNFAHQKREHKLNRNFFIGEVNVKSHFLLSASALNLNKLLKHKKYKSDILLFLLNIKQIKVIFTNYMKITYFL